MKEQEFMPLERVTELEDEIVSYIGQVAYRDRRIKRLEAELDDALHHLKIDNEYITDLEADNADLELMLENAEAAIDGQGEQMQRCMAQRDALLEACKAMFGLVTLGQWHAETTHDEEKERIEYEIGKVFAQAEDAIAKAKGEDSDGV